MSSGILDSSVQIDCLRGRANAIAFLATQSTTARPSTHLLVVAEQGLLTADDPRGAAAELDRLDPPQNQFSVRPADR